MAKIRIAQLPEEESPLSAEDWAGGAVPGSAAEPEGGNVPTFGLGDIITSIVEHPEKEIPQLSSPDWAKGMGAKRQRYLEELAGIAGMSVPQFLAASPDVGRMGTGQLKSEAARQRSTMPAAPPPVATPPFAGGLVSEKASPEQLAGVSAEEWSTRAPRRFGHGDFDYGLIAEAAEKLAAGMAYGELPELVEGTAFLRDPGALQALTLRGREGEQSLRKIASSLEIPGRSAMRKEELVGAITSRVGISPDIGERLAGMGARERTMFRGGLTPGGSALVGEVGRRREQLYTQSQALFGFGASNVDVALERAGISWQAVETLSSEELAGVLHGPIAQEFIARGGSRTVHERGETEYYAQRPRQEALEARAAGEKVGTVGIVAGAQATTIAQAHALQRGRGPGDEPELGEQEFYRGSGLIARLKDLLQDPGVAATKMGEQIKLIVADPGRSGKRVSQMMQQFGISLPGLKTVQSQVLGQAAAIPETIQKAKAWVSMGEWMSQGSGLYGTHLGAPTMEVTRRVTLPEGEEVAVEPGQVFERGEKVKLFGGHVGIDWGKDFERLVVQQATTTTRRGPKTKGDPEGKEYTEIQFQAQGEMASGSLFASKMWHKHGMSSSPAPTEMGVDVIVAFNELFQGGAAVAAVASPELTQEIWGETEEGWHWGSESGKQFVEWLTGPKSPIEERLMPAQTFDLSDPRAQKLMELGRLFDPDSGEAITPGAAKNYVIPGTKAAIRGQILDVGLEVSLGVRPTMVFGGKTNLIKPDAFKALWDAHPKLRSDMMRMASRSRESMSHVLAAVTANESPGIDRGQIFKEGAVPAAEIGKQWSKFAGKAHEIMQEAGYDEPEKSGEAMRSLIMALVGKAYPGRGISFEGTEETRYFPNPLNVMRHFGYPFQEDVLNQLPRQIAGMLEYEGRRQTRGEAFIPEDLIPEGQDITDFTPEQLEVMERKHRTGQVEKAYTEFATATSTKETLMKLLGVKTDRLVAAHPTPVSGIVPNKYVVGESLLGRMIIAPGASEEERAEIQGLITGGKLEGPRLGVVGYPIVDPGQAKVTLGYTTPGEAVKRQMVESVEQLNDMFGGRIGVDQVIAYAQEKDWDVDEMLRMIQTKYVRDRETGQWRASHGARVISTKDLRHMHEDISISGELPKHLEKIERAFPGPDEQISSVEKIKRHVGQYLDTEPITLEEFQKQTRDKAFGGISKGSAYNTAIRNIMSRMRGHPALEEARRTVAMPFQTALDLKNIRGGWKNIIERSYTFSTASMGWKKGWFDEPGEGGPAGYRERGISGYVDDTIEDVLGLTGMKGEQIAPQHLAAMLLSPAGGEEQETRWEGLTGLIKEHQAGKGDIKAIRASVYGSTEELETDAGLERLHASSPLLGAGLEAGSDKAMRTGTKVGEMVWRKTPRGFVGTTFGKVKATFAEMGGQVRDWIKSMSPQRQETEESRWSLSRRFEAVRAFAEGHWMADPATKAIVGQIKEQAIYDPWSAYIRHEEKGRRAGATPVEPSRELGSGLARIQLLEELYGSSEEETPSVSPRAPVPSPSSAAEPTSLQTRIGETLRSTIGFGPTAEDSAEGMYEFVKKSQRVRGEGHQSPLRQALNRLLGELPQEERGEAQTIWQQEVGQYGLQMGEGEGGVLYHQYREFTGGYEEFAATQGFSATRKFTNISETDVATEPSLLTKSEVGLLTELDQRQESPEAVRQAISDSPTDKPPAKFQEIGSPRPRPGSRPGSGPGSLPMWYDEATGTREKPDWYKKMEPYLQEVGTARAVHFQTAEQIAEGYLKESGAPADSPNPQVTGYMAGGDIYISEESRSYRSTLAHELGHTAGSKYPALGKLAEEAISAGQVTPRQRVFEKAYGMEGGVPSWRVPSEAIADASAMAATGTATYFSEMDPESALRQKFQGAYVRATKRSRGELPAWGEQPKPLGSLSRAVQATQKTRTGGLARRPEPRYEVRTSEGEYFPSFGEKATAFAAWQRAKEEAAAAAAAAATTSKPKEQPSGEKREADEIPGVLELVPSLHKHMQEREWKVGLLRLELEEGGGAKAGLFPGKGSPTEKEMQERATFLENLAQLRDRPAARKAFEKALGGPVAATAAVAAKHHDLGVAATQSIFAGKPITWEQQSRLVEDIGEERAGDLLQAGVYQVAGGLSRFEQLQQMSRPSRRGVVEALARGEITQTQARGFLRGKGQMEMTPATKRILQQVGEVGPTYKDVSPVVEQALTSLAAPPPTGGSGGGRGSGGQGGGTDAAAKALEAFTEVVKAASEQTVKQTDKIKEQVELYDQGKLRFEGRTPQDRERAEAAWTRDIQAAKGRAVAVTEGAKMFPDEAPEDMVAQQQGLIDTLRESGWLPQPQPEGAGIGAARAARRMEGVAGRIGGAATKLMIGWRPYQMERAWGLGAGPVTQQMIPAAAQAEVAGWQATMGIGGFAEGMPGGIAGGVMRYQAGQQQAMIEGGRAGYRAWGWAMRPSGAMQEARGVFGPAVSAGLIASIGASAFAALAPMAGPIGMGVAGVTAAVGGAQYLRSYGEESPETAIEIEEGGWGRAKGIVGRYMTTTLARRGGDPWTQPGVVPGREEPGKGGWSEAVEWSEEQAERARRFKGEKLGDLSAGDRMAALNWLAGERGLRKEGGIWEGATETQILGTIGGFAAYDKRLKEWSAEELTAGGGPVEWQWAQATGVEPKQYEGLAAQMRMGTGGAWELFSAGGFGLGERSATEQKEAQMGLGQYASLTRWMEPTDVAEKVLGRNRVFDEEEGRWITQQAGEPAWRTLEGPEAYQFERQMAGSPLAWSRLGMYGGEVGGTGQFVQPGSWEMVTQHPETGMAMGSTWGGGVLAQQIQGGRYDQPGFAMGSLAQEAFEMADITINATEATLKIEELGGYEAPLTQVGLQDLATRMQRDESQWQRGFQMEGLAAQYAYTTGGRLPGVPTPGADLGIAGAGAQGVLPGEAGQFLGRGMWDVQQDVTDAQRAYQETQFGFQWEQIGLSDQQFGERWGMAQQRLGVQTSWQQQDLGQQWERQQTKFGWAEADLAFKGAQTSMQYGWQMEDVEENLRYATGRQRRQLMKQRDRATVQFGMGMGQLDEQGERLDQRREWAEEDHNKAQGRFQQRTQWARQELDLQRRHHDQNQDLARRRLVESQKYFHTSSDLQDELTDLSHQYWEYTIGRQLASIEHNKTLSEQLNVVQGLLSGIATAQNQNATAFAAMWEDGGVINSALNNFGAEASAMLSRLAAQASSVGETYIRDNHYSHDSFPAP